MSLEKLYQTVTDTAEKAYMQRDSQDILNMAAAALHLANTYQVMKEVELHERFHMSEGGVIIPGEAPLNKSGAN